MGSLLITLALTRAINIINSEILRQKKLENDLRNETTFIVTEEEKMKKREEILKRYLDQRTKLYEAIKLLGNPVDD